MRFDLFFPQRDGSAVPDEVGGKYSETPKGLPQRNVAFLGERITMEVRTIFNFRFTLLMAMGLVDDGT